MAYTYRVFHHGEEEEGSDVTKAVDVLVDGGECLPEVFGPLQHQVTSFIRVDCRGGDQKGTAESVASRLWVLCQVAKAAQYSVFVTWTFPVSNVVAALRIFRLAQVDVPVISLPVSTRL